MSNGSPDDPSLFANSRRRIQLPDSVVDTQKDIGQTQGSYKRDDPLGPYINPRDGDKKTNPPTSTTNSTAELTPASEDDSEDVDVTLAKTEKWWQTVLQVSIPFFIAGVGTIAAGVILGNVKTWDVFQSISELFILVPALLGLKGNLDMTLAARLSTQANLGNMSSRKEIMIMVIGNISLVQVQATVASFIVSIFASGIGVIIDRNFQIEHALLVAASAMFTATSSCLILDFVLSAAIILCDKFKINPDNMATPLAAAIGDVVTITLLSLVTSLIYSNLATHLWVTYVIIGVYFLLLPCWTFIVLRNRYTRPVLKSGWIPVISALFISGLGGLVLERAVREFQGFVVFQPIINGVAGSLVTVQACRISTILYQTSKLGEFSYFARIFENPWRAIIHGTPYARTARILILISLPGQTLFIFIADFIQMSRVSIGAPFVFTYLFVSFIQVTVLLFIAHVITHAFWRFKIDPDTSTIPYLTSLGDLFGSSLLWGAFAFLRFVGHEYEGRASQVGAEFYENMIDFLLNPFGVTH